MTSGCWVTSSRFVLNSGRLSEFPGAECTYLLPWEEGLKRG